MENNDIDEWMHIIQTSSTSEGEIEKEEESWVALTPPKSPSFDTIFETETLLRMLGMRKENSSNNCSSEAWEVKCEKHKTPKGSPAAKAKKTPTNNVQPPETSSSSSSDDADRGNILRGLMKWCLPSSQKSQSSLMQTERVNRKTSPATKQVDENKVPVPTEHCNIRLRLPTAAGRGRLQSDEMTEQSDEEDDDEVDEDDVIDESFLRARTAYTLSNTL